MVVGNLQAENRVVLAGVTWSTYESLLAETKSRGTRFTYDRGYLEIMSPSRTHKRLKTLLGRMIEATTEVLDIPMSSAAQRRLRPNGKNAGWKPTNRTTSPTSRGFAAATRSTCEWIRRPTWPSRWISPPVRSTS